MKFHYTYPTMVTSVFICRLVLGIYSNRVVLTSIKCMVFTEFWVCFENVPSVEGEFFIVNADIISKVESSVNSPLKILVVDDDELNQRMMHMILSREGHQVSKASNGLEAFDLVKLNKFDAVLMDLQMPVLDGVETSRRIREWEKGEKHTFIVALTASYLPEKGQELFDAGVDNYISKPFDLEHLRQILMYSYNDRRVVDDNTLDATAIISGFDCEVGLKRVGGDEETYKELLGDFIQELPGRLESLHACILNDDFESLFRAAHNLKGVSANLGLLRLSEYAHKIENHDGRPHFKAIEDILADMETAVEELRKNVPEFLSRNKPEIN